MKNLYMVWFLIFLCLSIQATTDTPPIENEIPSATLDYIKQNAHTWATACASLSPDHLELLANVLYLSYRHAHLDEQTSTSFILLKKTFPSLRMQLRNYDTITSAITTFLHANKRFFILYNLRHHMYLSWQQCIHHVEEIDDVLLQERFDQLRTHGQTIIAEYVASRALASTAIPSLQQHIQQTINQLHAIEYVIEALVEKTNSNTQPSDTVIDLDRLVHISHRMHAITDAAHQSLDIIDTCQANVLAVSTYLFYQYYTALYALLPAGNQRLLFGPHGILTEQHQYTLPSPISINKNF